jgi:hypothetical protein
VTLPYELCGIAADFLVAKCLAEDQAEERSIPIRGCRSFGVRGQPSVDLLRLDAFSNAVAEVGQDQHNSAFDLS